MVIKWPLLVAKPDQHRQEQPTLAHEAPITGALPRTGKPFLLEQIQGPGAPKEFVLDLGETVIGRSLQATISIASSGISRQHMMLTRVGSEYSCQDMNSSNGVFLNGVKTHSAVLRQGDTLQLGDVVFVFHEGT